MKFTMQTRVFDKDKDGREVIAYTLESDRVKATILNFGGIVQSLVVDGVDVVCGFDTLEGYLTGGGYQGSTVGRYANRIRGGKFTLNGEEIQLNCNEGGVKHLHGGNIGFNVRFWDVKTSCRCGAEKAVFSLFSPDGDENYPGNLEVTVTFTVKGGDFSIEYQAVSDKDTILNMTNHSYFNLNGYANGDIMGHTLTIHADKFSAVDKDLIPVEERDVAGTPFDFREPKPVGRDIDADYDQNTIGHGYDHNFILNPTESIKYAGKKLGLGCELSGDKLTMQVYTNKPCVQLYSGNGIKGPVPFKGGVPQTRREALCLETQFAPDSPNHGGAILRAGDKYDYITLFRFI